ncbi:hypothetical protein OKA06_19470 [Novosphingobium sp. MW5]|nr:hypothetical protein [Novosphingobium sp. MW5]
MPYAAAIRGEQEANARGLVEAEAAVLMPESMFTPEALAATISTILTTPQAAARMARAATRLGMPDAAMALADLAERLAGPPEH